MKDFYAKNEVSTSRTQDYNHRVVLKFVVECDGTITNGRVIDSPSPEYTNKAMKLLSLMPKWTPAVLGGRAVRHEIGLPFALNEDDIVHRVHGCTRQSESENRHLTHGVEPIKQ